MKRTFTVIARQGKDPVSTAVFGDAEPALVHFENMLHASGHSDTAVAGHLRTLTATLMHGAQGYTVLDPDLNGSMELVITIK